MSEPGECSECGRPGPAWEPCRYCSKPKIGDRLPMPPQKLDIRPAFTGSGKPSHRPARKPGRFGA